MDRLFSLEGRVALAGVSAVAGVEEPGDHRDRRRWVAGVGEPAELILQRAD